MSRPLAWKLKNYSVYIGMIGYLGMLLTADVRIGAATKLVAEVLRIPYFRKTDAKDMERLSYFFIIASIPVLFKDLL